MLRALAGISRSLTETNPSSRAGAAPCRGDPAAGRPPCTGRLLQSWPRRRRCPPGALLVYPGSGAVI